MALVPSHNKALPGPVLILISRHMASLDYNKLTHLPLVLHICVSRLTIIGWDNGLSPIRRQAIIYSNAGLLLIAHLGTNISEILIKNTKRFIHENAPENIACETAAFFSRVGWVD